jgi:hypothetical protein
MRKSNRWARKILHVSMADWKATTGKRKRHFEILSISFESTSKDLYRLYIHT